MNSPPTQQRPALKTPGANAAALQGADAKSQRTTLRRHPAAFASRYDPFGRRRCYWIAFRCPHCSGAGHLGRSRERIDTGVRRASCGRLVWLVIAKVYTAMPERLEAAAS